MKFYRGEGSFELKLDSC